MNERKDYNRKAFVSLPLKRDKICWWKKKRPKNIKIV